MTGGTLFEGYGLSEASPVTHSLSLSRRKAGSIGVPLPDTDMKIVDLQEGTREVASARRGVVHCRPQNEGLLEPAGRNSNCLRGRSWPHRGYTLVMLPHGCEGSTYIVQRKKDMVIVGGFNVSPRSRGVYTHPAVLEAAVIGVPDAYQGEVVRAFVVLNRNDSTGEELIEHCRSGLAEFKVPRKIEMRRACRNHAVGKIC